MGREIVKVTAWSKEEAIAGLKMALNVIEKCEYHGLVAQSIIVENEGAIKPNEREI